ncbi:MAG: sigma-70 family RNA polymerase sigma factor, partial [Oscillospiraceae bacterium]
RGVKFSTYAVPVILGEIKRLFRDGGTVKVSRSAKELSMRISRLRENFSAKEGREPTVGELCSLSGESAEAVVEALNVALPPISLTESGDESEHGQIDIPTPAPDLLITVRLSLRQVMSELEARDRKLIFLRYFKNKTQTETAKLLDMTQVQVSRREKKILAMMKDRLE